MGKIDDILQKLYTNPKSPAGFAGVQQLYNEAQKHDRSISRRAVEQFLENQHTYTLHKPRKLRFERAKTHASGYMTHIQADLGDFQLLARQNKGFNYLLVAVDVLSRYVFVAPVKRKTPKEMKAAFNQIFSQMPMMPHNLFTDRGTEFEANEMKSYYKKLGIIKYCSQSKGIKASMAERMIRTLKSRLYRYFTENETTNWVDVIDKIADAVNNTVCRTTGLKPIEVNFENAQSVWEHVYSAKKPRKPKEPRYAEGDVVRISKEKGVFTKGYLPTFTDKLYDIKKVKRTAPTEYMLVDDEGLKIKGRFYEPELVRTGAKTALRIEKIFKKRKLKGGEKQVLVKLHGYKYAKWINENELFNE